ncbi:unnamed protein product [Ectocarpus fasciculatus]
MCGYIVTTIPVVGESGSTYVGISATSLYKTNDVIPNTLS